MTKGRVWFLILAVAAAAVLGSVMAPPAAAQARPQTIVSLTFDDGDATHFMIRNMLASRGMKATFYINSGSVGSSGYYMNWNQIKELARDGHEIGGHGKNHIPLEGLDPAVIRAEVCEDRDAIRAQGLNPVSFSYPEGRTDATVKEIVKSCGYTSGRAAYGLAGVERCTGCSPVEQIPPFDPFQLRVQSESFAPDPLARLQALVTAAERAGGGWVPLMFHRVCDNCESSITPAVFNAFLGWLQTRGSQGTIVRTVGDVMAGRINAAPAPTSVRITGLTVGVPRAGGLFTVRAPAVDNTGKRLQPAQVRCSLSIAGRGVVRTATAPRYVQGAAVCTWRLPANSRGRVVSGWIEPASGALKARRTFRATVR